MAEEVEMTPITPAEGESVPPKVSPFGAPPAASATPPAAAPAPAVSGTASTIRLKPVIRKPMIHRPTIGGAKTMSSIATPAPAPAPAAPAAPAAAPLSAKPASTQPIPPTLKRATQNLKSVTGPIPVQATLRKTGIIAEGIITPAQQQAAKSKTSRISLESAIGVAPAKDGPAPLKTIRLRRPADLSKPAGPAPLTAAPAPAAPAPAPVAAEAPAAEPEANDTQKKTMKLHRPGGPGVGVGIKKPLGIKKPEAAAPAPEAGEVSDIADIPDIKPLVPVQEKSMCGGVPTWVAVMSFVTTLAALAVIGVGIYFLQKEGRGTTTGPNSMAFIHSES